MSWIRKKIVRDEKNQPVAVQIDYHDWLRIERWLETTPDGKEDLNCYKGKIALKEDPLSYQHRIRSEWK